MFNGNVNTAVLYCSVRTDKRLSAHNALKRWDDTTRTKTETNVKFAKLKKNTISVLHCQNKTSCWLEEFPKWKMSSTNIIIITNIVIWILLSFIFPNNNMAPKDYNVIRSYSINKQTYGSLEDYLTYFMNVCFTGKSVLPLVRRAVARTSQHTCKLSLA